MAAEPSTSSASDSRIGDASVWIIGATGLLLAAAASWAMATHSVLRIGLPGCGPGSGCDQAAASAWGAIPLGGWRWPVAFVGAAYFTAMLAAWLAARGAPGGAWRWLVRLGVAASIVYVVIMLQQRMWCIYCITAHAGNVVFWIAAERNARLGRPEGGPWVVFGIVFIAASAALTIWQQGASATALETAERQRAESAARVIEQSANTGQSTGATGMSNIARRPFTGRWRVGPESSPIRIVIFSDYQCIDCKRVEMEIREILARHPDVSLSARHFPFCRPCNPHLDADMHANACWAARAAETAGMLRGHDGFWAMHHWLFDRGGGFTDAELYARLREQGYDAQQFVALMKSDQPLQRVQEDVEEAIALGIYFTPLIYINGVEMKGWLAPRALIRTVDELAATNPPARTAADDHPVLAPEKHIADWRDGPLVSLPADAHPLLMGSENAPVTIELWGDYQESFTAQADRLIRSLMDSRGDIRYHFRHYPVNQECNPKAEATIHAQACRAARAAEAAWNLKGPAAFATLHAWLMTHPGGVTDEALGSAAASIGIEPATLFDAMKSPQIDPAIAEDVAAAGKLSIRSIPWIYVNSRLVPRWDLEGHEILKQIIDEAAK